MMSETSHSSTRKLVTNMKHPLTHPSTEQVPKDLKATHGSRQSTPGTWQSEIGRQTGSLLAKSTRHHIPFAAFALVMLFMILCTFSLITPHSQALAHNSQVPAVNPANPANPPVNNGPTTDNNGPTADNNGQGTNNNGQSPTASTSTGPCSAISSSLNGGADLNTCLQCAQKYMNGITNDPTKLSGCRLMSVYIIDLRCKYLTDNDLKTCLQQTGDNPSMMLQCQNATDMAFTLCVSNYFNQGTPNALLLPTPANAPINQTTSYLNSLGNPHLSAGSSCEYFESALLSGQQGPNGKNGQQGSPPVPFCWNQNDFIWGVRDITCIVNHSHLPGTTYTENFSGEVGKTYDPLQGPTTQPVSGSVTVNTPFPRNQDTCTNNSTCVSDNASGNDFSDPSAIHDLTGGDNIFCANNACTSSELGTTDECGEPTGKMLEYNRFGCQIINQDMRDGGKNQDYDDNVGKGLEWDHFWDSTGVAINPTAYDPTGALYLPTTLLRNDNKNIQPSRNRPTCSANRWQCGNENGGQDSIVIQLEQGNLTQDPKSPQDADGHGRLNMVTAPNGHQVPVFWVVCNAVGGGWAFPCSDTTASKNMPIFTVEENSQSLDNGRVNEGFIKTDWFSGNYDTTADPATGAKTQEPGHLVYTYQGDTIDQAQIKQLVPIMLGAGYALMTPILILIGYQFLWSSWTLVRVSALEAFGRILLSVIAMSISTQVVAMLIGLTNALNIGIVAFHQAHPYPDLVINQISYSFTLQHQGENDPASFRGVVVPISRWGCIANDFVALIANKFWTDMSGYIPFVGGLAKFTANIFNAIDVAHHLGEFAVLILSITLCTQVFVRIILLNYYVLTAPLAFACWGLPAGVGQMVVRSWAKGIFSLLLVQTVQLFVLATFPLILPPFPSLPTDQFGLINTIIAALPRMLVLSATIQVPKFMGTQATKAIAQAGTVAGGAITAAGTMAMNIV